MAEELQHVLNVGCWGEKMDLTWSQCEIPPEEDPVVLCETCL